MENLEKLLNRYNKEYLYKQKSNVKIIRKYAEALEVQGLYKKIDNDFDYIDFEVIKTSYDNMRSIQDKFFQAINELGEVWEVINYQERHFLLYQKLEPFMDTLKCFYVDDKRHFIAYFGELLNAYYDHDMLMFVNEAYRKYLYDFKKIISSIKDYGSIPIKANFSQVRYVYGEKDAYVLYSDKVNRFYYIGKENKSYGIPRDINDQQVNELGWLIYNQNSLSLIEYLLENKLAGRRLKRRLTRMRRKLLK